MLFITFMMSIFGYVSAHMDKMINGEQTYWICDTDIFYKDINCWDKGAIAMIGLLLLGLIMIMVKGCLKLCKECEKEANASQDLTEIKIES